MKKKSANGLAARTKGSPDVWCFWSLWMIWDAIIKWMQANDDLISVWSAAYCNICSDMLPWQRSIPVMHFLKYSSQNVCQKQGRSDGTKRQYAFPRAMMMKYHIHSCYTWKCEFKDNEVVYSVSKLESTLMCMCTFATNEMFRWALLIKILNVVKKSTKR